MKFPVLICVLSLGALAQQPRSPQLPAPPPMRFVSAQERSQLDGSKDSKSRIRSTIDLASGRLTRTEELTTQSKFAEASEELGGYLGLIDNVRAFIAGLNHDKGSTRDLYRHLEIALRAHIPRLAVMRRSTPGPVCRQPQGRRRICARCAVRSARLFLWPLSSAREPAGQETRNDSQRKQAPMIGMYFQILVRSSPRRQRSPRRLSMLKMVGVLCAGIFFLSGSAAAQTRDHLTDAETDLVRYHQELDKRIEVFIKAIERRFAILNGAKAANPKPLEKGEPEWGEEPKGTRTQLLEDIAGILDEAITNLDDVSRRDEKNPLISRSLRKLTASANGFLTQLAALKKSSQGS